jgi:hypothetical protein
MALEGSAFVFNLLLSFAVSVRSILLEEEVLRRERWEEWLMAVPALGRVSDGCGEIGLVGGDMVVMASTIADR